MHIPGWLYVDGPLLCLGVRILSVANLTGIHLVTVS